MLDVLHILSLRDIQNAKVVLSSLLKSNVTNIKEGVSILESHLRKNTTGVGNAVKTIKQRGRRHLCPSCGKPTVRSTADSETIISCRACRWSALDEVR